MLPVDNVPRIGFVSAEEVVHHPQPLCVRHELGTVAQKPPGGNQVDNAGHPILRLHGLDAPLPQPQLLHHRAHVVLVHVHRQLLEGLQLLPVGARLENHHRAGALHLVALPAHLLDKHGKVEFAPPRHGEALPHPQGHHLKRHVRHGLPAEALLQMAAGDKSALLPREGRAVGQEIHGDGGRVDGHGRQGNGILRGSVGAPHRDVVHACNAHDVPAGGLVDLVFLVGLEAENLGDAGGLEGAVPHGHHRGLVDVHLPAGDFADSDAPQVGGVVQGGNQHLEGAVRGALGGGDVLDNMLAEGRQVLPFVIQVVHGPAVPPGGIDHGEIQEFVGGVEPDEEVEDLVHRPVGPRGGLVDFVDDHHDGEGEGEGLLQDEEGLGHGALLGVHQKERPVRHLQHPLHLAAEIRVSGSVDDVDGIVLVGEGAVLAGDGDAPFPLDGVGVHQAFLHLLVVPEHPAELEKLVHQGGLPVVHVGNDGDVANLRLVHFLGTPKCMILPIPRHARTAGRARQGKDTPPENSLDALPSAHPPGERTGDGVFRKINPGEGTVML